MYPVSYDPPALNAYGLQIQTRFDGPVSAADFDEAIGPIIDDIMALDADGDGFDNEAELIAGTRPGDDRSFPSTSGAPESINPCWNVCGYDHAYAFKKVSLDFCGYSPRYSEMQAFKALATEAKEQAIEDAFERCVDTPYWRGRDGVLWRMAHPKVRPLAAIKSGPQAGPVPLGDYDDDYALFVHTHTDDRDVREVITADYYVTLTGSPPEYVVRMTRPEQSLAQEYRVGLISSRWFFVINTMFTAVPRTAAAQAYRAYLGLDIAKSEGLFLRRAADRLRRQRITADGCAACHTTPDPLTYPFSRYEGIAFPSSGITTDGMARRNPAIDGAGIRTFLRQGIYLANG